MPVPVGAPIDVMFPNVKSTPLVVEIVAQLSFSPACAVSAKVSAVPFVGLDVTADNVSVGGVTSVNVGVRD